MGFFDFSKRDKKKKIGETEFIKDPASFIQFLKEDDKELVEFGTNSLIAAGSEIMKPLIKLLMDEKEDVKVRRRTGPILGKIGKPAVEPLLEVIKKQNLQSKSSSETLGIAAAALGMIGEDAVEALIRAMESEDRHVRFGAAIALLQTGEPKAIDVVRKAARNGNQSERKMFEMVLSKYGE